VTGAARGHWDLVAMGKLEQAGDGRGGAGQGDGFGDMGGEPFVARVTGQDGGLQQDFPGQKFLKLAEQHRSFSLSLRATKPGGKKYCKRRQSWPVEAEALSFPGCGCLNFAYDVLVKCFLMAGNPLAGATKRSNATGKWPVHKIGCFSQVN
jgi:hypothetical protein